MEDENQVGISPLSELVAFLREYAREHPGCTKDALAKATANRFNLARDWSVFVGPDYAIRFSHASGDSFSNTVVSLAKIRKYDHLPFIVCVVRPRGIQLLLANATFVKKVSHTSQKLRIDKIRGSIIGSNILREYSGIGNTPENFEPLFAIHQQFTWLENLERIVAQTGAIAAKGVRFEPNADERRRILDSAKFADAVVGNPEYLQLERELSQAVETRSTAILQAAQTDNVNQRGNRIEQIITEAGNVHTLEDLTRRLASGPEIGINIKSKVFGLASNPTACNIEKILRFLARGNTLFCFFFVGIDRDSEQISTRLVSILDRTILGATRIDSRWAGRNSRGAIQLTGDVTNIFNAAYRGLVDVGEAETFLDRLIDLQPPASM